MSKVNRAVGDLMLTTDLITGMNLVRVAVFRRRAVSKLRPVVQSEEQPPVVG